MIFTWNRPTPTSPANCTLALRGTDGGGHRAIEIIVLEMMLPAANSQSGGVELDDIAGFRLGCGSVQCGVSDDRVVPL